MLCMSLQAGEIPLGERRSGYEFMGRDTRAMQDDDSTNPALFWLMDGETLWKRKDGVAACSSCHETMKGVAARYPKVAGGRAVNLEQQINACRSERQKAAPLAYESRELLALTAYVARQSRGMPIEAGWNERTEAGRALFTRRQGQLNLACTQCHDDNWGKQLSGTTIPQAHPTGYPIYRLEWQDMGSLQRRLRNCMIGVRAEPYPYGSAELVDLELYLMWRARGMKLETPAVRP
ncbi:MAG: sulfur oxidation c-type cytochrome SoxA [Betaproteobacteria bacterium]|nr:MAG: sulfur oxidation c-type cytochrome SoxA [Betaproteobacteria bacterium]